MNALEPGKQLRDPPGKVISSQGPFPSLGSEVIPAPDSAVSVRGLCAIMDCPFSEVSPVLLGEVFLFHYEEGLEDVRKKKHSILSPL